MQFSTDEHHAAKTDLFVYLFICLFVYLFICLFVYLFVVI